MNPVPLPVTQSEQGPAWPVLKTSLPGWTQLPAERQHELVLSLAALLVKHLSTVQLSEEVADD
jgi:hypothetical protein